MFILDDGKKVKFDSLEDLLKARGDGKYLCYDVYFDEFPIHKNELSKLYMLFARGGYFEEGYGYEESVSSVFKSAILKKFGVYHFNYERIVYVKQDRKFYFEEHVSVSPEQTYEDALFYNKRDYNNVIESIEMIKPFLEFVKDYDLVQCTFDKEVVKKFKKKFGRKNYHLD